METRSRIARYGNSLTVRIPVAVARELDLRAGDTVLLRTVAEGVFIERSKQGRLATRLATVTVAEAEIGTGHAVGAEVFE